jgi:hypothetical protein
VKLPKFLGGAPATSEPRRRRRRPRADAPRTIVPVVGEHETPSWLKDRPAPRAPHTPGRSVALDLDAARERLRREIPPVGDDL